MATQWIADRPRNYDWPEALWQLHEACQSARAAFERVDDALHLLRRAGREVRALETASGTLMTAWIRLERVAAPQFAVWDAEDYFWNQLRVVPVLAR